jgi:hypothetical protein
MQALTSKITPQNTFASARGAVMGQCRWFPVATIGPIDRLIGSLVSTALLTEPTSPCNTCSSKARQHGYPANNVALKPQIHVTPPCATVAQELQPSAYLPFLTLESYK